LIGSTFHLLQTAITCPFVHDSPSRTCHGKGRSHHGPVSAWRSLPDIRCHAATSAAISRSTFPGRDWFNPIRKS